MSDLTAARARLAARQRTVLAYLLAGEVPPGFDERTTRSAAAQLVGKRRHEAVQASPELAAIDGFPALFDGWAKTGPRVGCAHDDVGAFLSAAGEVPAVRDWVAERDVLAGRRRLAVIHRCGRRELLVGAGTRYWRIAWRAATVSAGDSDRRGAQSGGRQS